MSGDVATSVTVITLAPAPLRLVEWIAFGQDVTRVSLPILDPSRYLAAILSGRPKWCPL